MILITGATGHLGKATVDFLLEKTSAAQLAVMVRDSAKAAAFASKGIGTRQGDYSDYASLEKAFDGVDTLLLISSASMDNRFEQHSNAIKAAVKNNVKYIVYTSMLRASPASKFLPAVDHYQTEVYLKGTGIP